MSDTSLDSNRESVIEQHSIDYIPHSERHGKVWHQDPFWFTGNFVLPTLVTGFIGPSMGLSVWFSVLSILLGALLASYIPNADPILALHQIGDLLFPGFGTITVLVSVLALISIMGVNAYGAMLTGSSAIDGFTSVRPTVRLRVSA